MHADRRAHEVVVEEVRKPSRRGLPAHVLHLARARLAVLGVGLGRVVVVARLRGPLRVGLRVERPVRQVDALHGVGERAPLERVGREPQLAVPLPDAVARRRLADHERQHALGTERGLGFLVRNELRRTAELAVLRLARGIEHRDRVAALALHLALVGLPAARLVADAAQRRDEIVLDDLARALDRASPATRCRRTGRRASACAGFQIASPPHAGHANFSIAEVSATRYSPTAARATADTA